MNLLLLHPQERLKNTRYCIAGRRFHHTQTHLKLQPGDTLKAGLLNEKLGTAQLICYNADNMIVDFEPQQAPPTPTDTVLLLALPRPKMLKRILIEATTFGVKHIILLNASKVDKSYWSTPKLHRTLLEEKLLLGLEQAGDTLLPTLQFEKRFKPFVEDHLPELCQKRHALLVHPGGHAPLPSNLTTPAIIAIGPEGGWTDYECDKLEQASFKRYQFGQRILRVETAVTATLGRLMALS